MAVRQQLAAILGDASEAALRACTSLEEEFKVIKKAYFKAVLANHPDKGGEPSKFREIQTAFEGLRDAYAKGKVRPSFAAAAARAPAPEPAEAPTTDGAAERQWRSYEYYQEAAAAFDAPLYKVEPAKSGRSKCRATGEPIAKGAMRVGSLDAEAGTYSRWVQLSHWRVPAAVWLYLSPISDLESNDAAVETALFEMDEVLLKGIKDLQNPADLRALVAHVQDKTHWARKTKRGEATHAKAKAKQQASSKSSAQQPHTAPVPGPPAHETKPTTALAPRRALAGKTVVLTGIFPSLGGGAGLDLGKERARALIEAHGGRVTSAVSGRTDYLLVGDEPGFSKVSKARASPRCKLVDLPALRACLDAEDTTTSSSSQQPALEDAPEAQIESFSAGYRGNGLALMASEDDLRFAREPRTPQQQPPGGGRSSPHQRGTTTSAASSSQHPLLLGGGPSTSTPTTASPPKRARY